MTVSPKPMQSRLDPEPISRRDWLGLASLWTGGAALLFGIVGLMRLPKAAVLSSPSKKFHVIIPDTLAAGDAFIPPGRSVAIFRDAAGVHAISTTCTHLGCLVKAGPSGFECPCHGSRFATDGSVTKGPAPRALPWLKVSVSGSVATIDEGTTVVAGTKSFDS